MFFAEEVAYDVRLLLSSSQVRSGIGHHLRLVAWSLASHGLLQVLFQHLGNRMKRSALKREEKTMNHRLP